MKKDEIDPVLGFSTAGKDEGDMKELKRIVLLERSHLQYFK